MTGCEQHRGKGVQDKAQDLGSVVHCCSVAKLCLTLCDPMDHPGQNTGVDSPFHLQGIFPTQGLNPGLWYCRQIRYHLSHHTTFYLFFHLFMDTLVAFVF